MHLRAGRCARAARCARAHGGGGGGGGGYAVDHRLGRHYRRAHGSTLNKSPMNRRPAHSRAARTGASAVSSLPPTALFIALIGLNTIAGLGAIGFVGPALRIAVEVCDEM